jgi:Putative MetA-pathway of phenol degradation
MFLGNTSLLLATAITIFCWSNVHAGRPLFTDDTSPVLFQHLEVEFGVSTKHLKSGQSEHGLPSIAVAYGIYPEIELGISIRRINREGGLESHSRGFEDLHLTTKYRISEETALLPAFAVDLDIKLPTASRSKGLSTGKSEETFRTSATKNFHSIAAHLNLGYALVHSPSGEKLKNRIFGGAAIEWLFRPGLALVAEIFAVSRSARDDANELEFQTGLKYALRPYLVLDAALGRSLRSSGTAVQGTAGLTWTVDLGSLLGR